MTWYRVGIALTNNRETAADWARSRVGANTVDVLGDGDIVTSSWRYRVGRWEKVIEQLALDV